MAALSLVVMGVLVGSCFRAAPPDGAIACGAEPHPCPQDYHCAIDHTCRRGADPVIEDLGVEADGTVPSPDLALEEDLAVIVDAAAPCQKTGCFQDDFQDGVRAAFWDQTYSVGPILGELGVLLVSPSDPTPSTAALSAYVTSPLDLTVSSIAVELVQAPNTAAAVYVLFTAKQDGAKLNRLQIFAAAGTIVFRKMVDSVATDVMLTFDPLQHRWWRIREVSGTTYFDTSDGFTWTQRASTPTPAFANQVNIELGGGTVTMISNPGVIKFDNFNINLPPG